MTAHECSHRPNGAMEPSGPCIAPGHQPVSRKVAVDEEFLRRALRDAACFAQYHATSGDPDSPRYIREYEVALLELADAPALETSAEWGVAYEDRDIPGGMTGVRDYDDQEDAETTVLIGCGDFVVTRTVTWSAGPWQRVPSTEAAR